MPEYHEATPEDAPINDVPELEFGVNPEDAPVLELPELVVETPKEEQDVPGVPNEDKPVLPVQPIHILPQTGSTTSPLMALVGLGLMTLSLGGWFTLNKRK